MSVPYVSTKDASDNLKISEQRIRTLLREGALEGQQVGKTWVVHSDSVEQYKINHNAKNIIVDDRRAKIKKNSKIKALSFCSGAMGLDIGLEKSGIEVVLACEIDKRCRQTIIHNRPDIGLIGNIDDYNPQEIIEFSGLSNDDIDLIVGGPPCQAFSTAGSRQGFKDLRGNVFLSYINLLLKLRPRYAVIENVRGLLSAPLNHRPHSTRGSNALPLRTEEKPGGALLHVLEMLRDGGYGVTFNLYNTANYGVPQIRERVVIICSRDGDKLPYLYPTHSENPLFGLPKWKTLYDAIHDLDNTKAEHINFPENRLKYYKLLKEGQYWKHLPQELQKVALGKSYYSGGGKTGFLRRLAWNKPSCTLVTHPAMPATDICHPQFNRPLSIQEYKRIQQFPDNWIFCGSLIEQYRQIGNAVPVGLGMAIGKAIIAHKNQKNKTPPKDFPYSRYKDTDETSWENKTRKELKLCGKQGDLFSWAEAS